MKVLLIGNGAREHVIAETLLKSNYAPELVVFGKAKNPGIFKIASYYSVGSLTDCETLGHIIKKNQPDFAIIGPEDPIAFGVSDFLQARGVKCVAPLKELSLLEASKSFTRELLTNYDIPGCPRYQVFHSDDGLKEFAHELEGEFVVKADGLRSGKGVKVSGDHFKTIDEGIRYASDCINQDGKVVIEERLIGQEFSLMSFCDGISVCDMPAVQDHKRAFEGDQGPNTGGMGSYSDANHLLPFLTPHDVKEAHDINQRVCHALFEETEMLYQGILYGGFMATSQGVKLIEYNARFGDPEAMNVLPLLTTDFVDVCKAILEGSLKSLKIEFARKATVCVYVVPEGYPEHPLSGERIEIGHVPDGVRIYYAAVDQKNDGIYMSSSRAVALLGIADSLTEAHKLASDALGSFKGRVSYRKDIGSETLINKRVKMMESLRGTKV